MAEYIPSSSTSEWALTLLSFLLWIRDKFFLFSVQISFSNLLYDLTSFSFVSSHLLSFWIPWSTYGVVLALTSLSLLLNLLLSLLCYRSPTSLPLFLSSLSFLSFLPLYFNLYYFSHSFRHPIIFTSSVF